MPGIHLGGRPPADTQCLVPRTGSPPKCQGLAASSLCTIVGMRGTAHLHARAPAVKEGGVHQAERYKAHISAVGSC